ncbi:MAG: S-layer homology domain-containing protein, partial [Candidatus Margulisiibacteriota bacterium]
SALILNPGKNLAVLSGFKNDGSVINIFRKILRVVRYPDMDELYSGRPHWAKKIITELATAGIIEAFPDGRFMPDDLVTRGEFATWLCRAKGLSLEAVSYGAYRDVPDGHWRAPYIYAVTKKGYIGAGPADTFGIDEPLSRVDAAYSITKAVGLLPSFDASQAATIEAYINELKSRTIEAAIQKGYFVGVSNRFRMYDFSRDMTRAEAANSISRIEEAKNRVNFVYDWRNGYDNSSLCTVNSAPDVSAYATPEAAYADGKSTVTIFAKAESLSEIVVVKANLKQIDGPADAVMYDDASRGDAAAGDGVFSLSFPINTNVPPGYKEFFVTVVNKWGLSASSKARLWVYADNNVPK